MKFLLRNNNAKIFLVENPKIADEIEGTIRKKYFEDAPSQEISKEETEERETPKVRPSKK